jgi:hypothetical protein
MDIAFKGLSLPLNDSETSAVATGVISPQPRLFSDKLLKMQGAYLRRTRFIAPAYSRFLEQSPLRTVSEVALRLSIFVGVAAPDRKVRSNGIY